MHLNIKKKLAYKQYFFKRFFFIIIKYQKNVAATCSFEEIRIFSNKHAEKYDGKLLQKQNHTKISGFKYMYSMYTNTT